MWCWLRRHKLGMWGKVRMNNERDCYQVRTCETCGKMTIRWIV